MTTQSEMSTKYDHQAVEAGRYQKWLEQDLFKPNGNPEAKPNYIVITTPNVKGKLKLGTALDKKSQDIFFRSCLGYYDSGYFDSSKTYARL